MTFTGFSIILRACSTNAKAAFLKMALMTKIKCPCIISWVRARLTVSNSPFRHENSVFPVRINVQPKMHNDNTDSMEDKNSASSLSIFSVENQYLGQCKELSTSDDNNHIDQQKNDSHELSITDDWPKATDSIISESNSRQSPDEGLEIPGSSLKLPTLSVKNDRTAQSTTQACQSVPVKLKSLISNSIVRDHEPVRDVVDEKSPVTSKPSNFTHAHFDLMYCLGVSSYRTRPHNQIDSDDRRSLLLLVQLGAHLVCIQSF